LVVGIGAVAIAMMDDSLSRVTSRHLGGEQSLASQAGGAARLNAPAQDPPAEQVHDCRLVQQLLIDL